MNLENIAAFLLLISIPIFAIGFIMLIIQAIRKKKKKPAVLIMVISVLMFVGGFILPIAGDLGEIIPSISTNNIDKEIESKVNGDVSVYCMFNYKDVKSTLVNVTSIKQDGNTYVVYGKVNIIDNYGDKYTGNFNATYRLENDALQKVDLSVETPRK